MDKQLARAIRVAVRHTQTPTEDELRTIEKLHVLRARDLSGLESCTSMRHLVLSGCDPVSFQTLTGMRDLEVAIVEYCGLKRLDGVEELSDSFLYLKAPNNSIEDLSPLLDCPGLNRLEVQGNPLSEQSYLEVLPRLRSRGVQVFASGEREWRLTRRLHEIGLPFSYYHSDEGHQLCRPGLSYTDWPATGHPIIDPDDLERLIDGEPTRIHELFAQEELMFALP